MISGGANGGNMQPPPDNEDRALNALMLAVSAGLGFLDGDIKGLYLKNLKVFAKSLGLLALLTGVLVGFSSDNPIEGMGLAIATYIITTLLIRAMVTILAGTLIASAGLLPAISMFITASVAGLAILISNMILSINNIYYFKKIDYV